MAPRPLAAGEALALLLAALSLFARAQEESFGETCLNKFTTKRSGFMLDLHESVQNGTTYLASNPNLHRGKECVRECCKTPGCNLALVEEDPDGEDLIRSCFLFNCLYEQAFVCKFSKKKGFLSYVEHEVYESLVTQREHMEGDHLPIARAGMDMKVQPMESVTLSGIESWDDEGISSYEWEQIVGDNSVEMVKTEPDLLEVSNLQVGLYVFQLTVTDTAGQKDTAKITITVLSEEQTAEYCLAPIQVGRCRGSFSRWHYNPVTEQCEKFIFGGCKGNKNNYLREEECQIACKNIPGPNHPTSRRLIPVCDAHCTHSQFQCNDGCCIDRVLECDNTADCKDHSDESSCDKYDKGFGKLSSLDVETDKVRCVDFPYTGPCRASIPRWYYDPYARECFRFTYGGCSGNKNNFLDKDHCLEQCKGVTENDVFGRRIGPHEAQEGEGSGSAHIALAVLLGICILATLAVLGYCFLKKRNSSRRHQPITRSATISTTEDTEHLVYNTTTKPV